MTKDNFVYSGKSKDIYRIPDGEYKGKYAFVFSDRGTGYLDENNRPVFDPGYDYVVGEIPGKGAIVCKFVTYFMRLLQARRVPTHYIATVGDNVMIVEPATPLSLPEQAPEFAGSAPLLNLEWTWRNNAIGSFWRRYPFVKPCQNLAQVVEAWTKGQTDKLITFEALAAAGVMSEDEIAYVKTFVKDIAKVVNEEFASRGPARHRRQDRARPAQERRRDRPDRRDLTRRPQGLQGLRARGQPGLPREPRVHRDELCG